MTEQIGLPSGFEIVTKGPLMIIEREQLPWLESEKEAIRLARIKLSGSGNFEFYLGSLVAGKKLKKAAASLDEHRSRIANNLFYTDLPDFIRNGYNPAIKIADNVITQRQIMYSSNPSGQRVYFMRFDGNLNSGLEKLPVIVKIAACDKSLQDEVLSVITNRSRRFIKSKSKL